MRGYQVLEQRNFPRGLESKDPLNPKHQSINNNPVHYLKVEQIYLATTPMQRDHVIMSLDKNCWCLYRQGELCYCGVETLAQIHPILCMDERWGQVVSNREIKQSQISSLNPGQSCSGRRRQPSLPTAENGDFVTEPHCPSLGRICVALSS